MAECRESSDFTDVVENQCHSETLSPSSSTLEFPCLPIEHSFHTLLSYSRTTKKMDELVHVERPSSSLSASWATLSNADILSNSSSALEDDAHSQSTDAVSLLDQHTPDDATSLDGDSRNLQGEEDIYDDNPESSDLSRGQYLNQAEAGHDQDSQMTARPPGIEAIEFQEPQSWPDAELVDLKHTIRVFDNSETRSMGRDLCPGISVDQVFGTFLGTTRMTMSKNTLPRDTPLRILYAGDSWGRRKILEKLGEALLSGRQSHSTHAERTDRYSIITAPPTGSFSESTPLDTQIIVHDCLSSAAAEEIPGSKSITLSFRNITLFTSRSDGFTSSGQPKYVISSRSTWMTPDLAILFVSNRDHSNGVKDFYQNIHTFTQRHDIPCLKIVEDNPWDLQNDFSPIERPTLHLCIESRTRLGTEAKVLKRLPVDLETYESIEPSQLNKNIACLKSLRSISDRNLQEDVLERQSPAEHTGNLHGVDWLRFRALDILNHSPLAGSPYSAWFLRHPAIGFGLLICCASLLGIASYLAIQLPILLVTTLTSSLLNKAELAPPTSLQNLSITPLLTSTSTASLRPAITQSTKGASIQSDYPKGLAEVHQHVDMAQILADPVVHSTNLSEKLQVHIVGDCHMIVKLPQRLLQRKKLPSLEVTVERGEQVVHSTTVKLFDGVYTIKIALEEAHGALNVTISSARPWISETHEIDFGASWLKPAGWRKAAQIVSEQFRKDVGQFRDDLDSAQSSMQIVYERIANEAYLTLRDASKEASKKSSQLHEHYRALVTHKSKQLSDVVRYLEEAMEAKHVRTVEMLGKLEATREGLTACAKRTRQIAHIFAKNVSRTMIRNTKKAQIATAGYDLVSLRQRLKEVKVSKLLATAQGRAQKALRKNAARTNGGSERGFKKHCGQNCRGSDKLKDR